MTYENNTKKDRYKWKDVSEYGNSAFGEEGIALPYKIVPQVFFQLFFDIPDDNGILIIPFVLHKILNRRGYLN